MLLITNNYKESLYIFYKLSFFLSGYRKGTDKELSKERKNI